MPTVETDPLAFAEYATFQYTLGEATLFKGVRQLLPGHALAVENGTVRVWRYWDVHYEIDYDHSPAYFQRRLQELLDESLRLHLRGVAPATASPIMIRDVDLSTPKSRAILAISAAVSRRGPWVAP